MNFMRSAAIWIIITMGIILFVFYYNTPTKTTPLKIFEVFELAEEGKITKLEDRGGKITGEYKNDNDEAIAFKSEYLVGQMGNVFKRLEDAGLIIYDPKRDSEIFKLYFLPFILPLIIILGFWFFLMRSIQSGGNKAMSFGKSKARLVHQGQTNVTFEDVAGVEEAKQELHEVVEFLKDPQKFSRLGAKIPKGVLLHGPPGTGKTLLAKAVAGEANVPFFSISGSDFVEMFVGVGASRVRDLFEQGKKHKPCLIFMDEIDAVGRHRFAGVGGGHDEREQTLNQLLVEMDGFNTNEGIILIAATNRADVLDPALLRPGRFDRRIVVDYPDVAGREKILGVHLKNVKHDEGVEVETLARSTMGFSGADLANLVNEAALLAARNGKDKVTIDDLEEAKDRVIMGPERRSIRQISKDKEIIAYHEAGHALTAKYLKDTDPVHKVTIIPRGKAMGLTAYLPNEDLANLSRKNLKNKLVTIMGGRAAEEIHFGEYTTGAVGDIQQVTHLSHKMVCEFGMSEKLGPRAFGDGSGQVFLGKDMTRERNYSENSATQIDAEVQEFITEAHTTARNILTEHEDVLDKVSQALLERETLSNADLDLIMEGKELPPIVAKKPENTDPPASEETETDQEKATSSPPPIPKLEPGGANA